MAFQQPQRLIMKTVGQILASERKRKKWTLEEVQKFTKIHPEYIKALENGDYDTFKGKVHVKGFLKIYAEFLELDVDQTLAFWRREYEAGYERGRKEKVSKYKRSSIKIPKITFDLKTYGFLSSFILIALFFSYVFYQYQRYSKEPILIINSPKNGSIVKQNFIEITGKTEPGSDILINNQPLGIDEEGGFSTVLSLNQGINSISLTAKNSLGNLTTKDLTVVYNKPLKLPAIELEIPPQSSESTPTRP